MNSESDNNPLKGTDPYAVPEEEPPEANPELKDLAFSEDAEISSQNVLGDETYIDLLKEVASARARMERVFAAEGATDYDKRTARDELATTEHRLDDYREEHGYKT